MEPHVIRTENFHSRRLQDSFTLNGLNSHTNFRICTRPPLARTAHANPGLHGFLHERFWMKRLIATEVSLIKTPIQTHGLEALPKVLHGDGIEP